MKSNGMNGSKRNNWDLIKLVWIIGIFYFIFVSNFFGIWQKIETLLPHKNINPNIEKNTLEEEIQNHTGNVENHQWAIDAFKDIIVTNISGNITSSWEEKEEWKRKFSNLCLEYLDVCKKIEFAGDIWIKNKYIFLASSIQIYDFIEKNLLASKSIDTQLRSINIDPDKNGKRGSANAYGIKINTKTIKSYEEFFDLFSHEIGHVVDLGLIEWKEKEKNLVFTEFWEVVFSIDDLSLLYYWISRKSEATRKSEVVRQDFCSNYGMTDPFEDFSECHTLYLNHNALFVYMAERNESLKKKYNFFASIYDKKFIFEGKNELDWIQKDPDKRVRDTTKISYNF